MAFVISATTSRSRSLGSVGKLDSVIRRLAKLTSRSSSDTRELASSLIVPSAGLAVPRRLGLIRGRRERHHLLLVGPTRDLRLVDDHATLARRRVGSRPAAIHHRLHRAGGGFLRASRGFRLASRRFGLASAVGGRWGCLPGQRLEDGRDRNDDGEHHRCASVRRTERHGVPLFRGRSPASPQEPGHPQVSTGPSKACRAGVSGGITVDGERSPPALTARRDRLSPYGASAGLRVRRRRRAARAVASGLLRSTPDEHQPTRQPRRCPCRYPRRGARRG